MLRPEERIEICKTCSNRSFNTQTGLVCGLTNESPTFEYTCKDFTEDEKKMLYDGAVIRNSGNTKNKIERSSMGVRFGNYILDAIVLGVLSFMLPFSIMSSDIELPWFINFASWGISVLYYAVFEISTGKTLGKMITGCKVVTLDGRKPTTEQIIIRSFCRLIPFNALSFLFTDAKNGWHDRISKTIVVDKSYEEETEGDEILDRF